MDLSYCMICAKKTNHNGLYCSYTCLKTDFSLACNTESEYDEPEAVAPIIKMMSNRRMSSSHQKRPSLHQIMHSHRLEAISFGAVIWNFISIFSIYFLLHRCILWYTRQIVSTTIFIYFILLKCINHFYTSFIS